MTALKLIPIADGKFINSRGDFEWLVVSNAVHIGAMGAAAVFIQ